MSENIQTSSPAPAPSKQAVPSKLTYRMSPAEFAQLQTLHRHLHIGLQGILALSQRDDLPGDLPRLLQEGVPRETRRSGTQPFFVTTEIVLDRARQPRIVRIDGHTASGLELLVQLSKGLHGNVTTSTHLMRAIRERLGSRKAVTIIRHPKHACPYPHLAKTLEAHGIGVIHQTIQEACASADTLPILLDHPIMLGRPHQQTLLHRQSRSIIAPHVVLSSQHTLAILSNAEENLAVDLALREEIPLETLDLVRASIPKMYSLRPGIRFKDFSPSILKHARPLERQGIHSYVGSSDLFMNLLNRQPYEFVTQETIRPALTRTIDDHDQPVSRRFRLLIVSYEGHVLTCGCIVEIPENGQPQQHIGLGVYVA